MSTPVKPETSHRATIENGPSVVDGRLIWTSATGITTADPNSYAGCTRRWFYETVEGKKGPPTRAMLAGTELHSELEDHLRTGAVLSSPLALSGRSFVPHPGSGLLVEKPIHFKTSTGVDIYGHVDVYNLRGQYIDPEGALQQDVPWALEVKDWKTTSDFQYAKSEAELASNIQLITYAEAGFRMWPDFEHARLTHVYFRTRGKPESRLVTVRRSREEISARWEYASAVVRVMADAAAEPLADRVPGNHKSCGAYGGCPHRGYCSGYQKSSLDATYGKVAADFSGALKNEYERIRTVGLLSQVTQVDQRAELLAEEQRLRAQQAQIQQVPPTLAELQSRILAHGRGFPALGGNAAQAYAAFGGQSVAPGFVFAGKPAPPGTPKPLHNIQLTEVAHFSQLLAELDAEAAQTAPAPYVPAAPTPTPAPVAPTPVAVIANILPPEAPPSMPELAMARPTPPQPEAPPAPSAPKKRGRPSKDVSAPAPEPVAERTPPTQTAVAPVAHNLSATTQVTPVQAPTSPEAPAMTGTLSGFGCVLVNARFANRPTISLAGYVDHINTTLSKFYCVTADGKPGIQDVRCAPKDSPLAFGAWKGAVREVVKAEPPSDGEYHIDTGVDELYEVVADALRVVAERKGWLFVRGVR